VIALSDFDPVVVERYGITEEKLSQVVRYVQLLQGENAPTLRDIAVGGYYGTSALLHEVVELEMLLSREPDLLAFNRQAAHDLFLANLDAHLEALIQEYLYLQNRLEAVFGELVDIGALVLANANRRDFELLVESDWPEPLFVPLPMAVERAAQLLEQLKQRGKVL